jgi:hypothetical protein
MIAVSLGITPCSAECRSLFLAEVIPVPAKHRSLMISGQAGSKFRRGSRFDWVCEAGQFLEREIGLSNNVLFPCSDR